MPLTRQKEGLFDGNGENNELAFYPPQTSKTRVLLLKAREATKKPKMAGVTRAKAWLTKGTVFLFPEHSHCIFVNLLRLALSFWDTCIQCSDTYVGVDLEKHNPIKLLDSSTLLSEASLEMGVFWKWGSFGKGGLLEKGSLQKNPFSRALEILGNPQTVENKGESFHSLKILENLELFETLDIPPVKTPFAAMTPFSGPDRKVVRVNVVEKRYPAVMSAWGLSCKA